MKISSKNPFLNEKLILVIIVLNAVILFLQECGIDHPIVNTLDLCCTVIFVVEMVVKHLCYGFKGYWSSGWNRLDGTLVILSLPSLASLFVPVGMMNFSAVLVLRVFRVFRFFRLVHVFPGFTQIARNFVNALKQSFSVLLGMMILIFMFAMISCSLFRESVPEFFATPMDAIYSTFRIFTGEGWNEIPDTVVEAMGQPWGHLIRLYFCGILIVGCIIGMSLLNSIFVDAMVADNEDDIRAKLSEMHSDLEEIKSRLK